MSTVGIDGRLSVIPILVSSCLHWVLYLALLGLAYRTNPSERSFRSFLTELSVQDHLAQLPASKRCRSSSVSQKKTHTRNSNRRFQPVSSSGKLSMSLRTPLYNIHNLCLCTLISIEHATPGSSIVSEENGCQGTYEEAEWFLGCFGAWWTLDRQCWRSWVSTQLSRVTWVSKPFSVSQLSPITLTDWAAVAAMVTHPSWDLSFSSCLKSSQLLTGLSSIWQTTRRLVGQPWLGFERPILDQSLRSTQSQPKKKNQTVKKTTLFPSSIPPLRPRALSETQSILTTACSEDTMSCTSLSDQEGFAPVLSSQPSLDIVSDSKSGYVIENSSGDFYDPCHGPNREPLIKSPAPPHNEPSFKRSNKTRKGLNRISDSQIRHDSVIHQTASRTKKLRQTTRSSSFSNLPRPASCLPQNTRQESTGSTPVKPSKSTEQNISDSTPSTAELEKELQELKFKKNQEDLVMAHYKPSLKHLGQLKELKQFKRLNLEQKLEQFKLAHEELSKKSAKFKQDLEALKAKRSNLESEFPKQVEQMKREEDRFKAELRRSELEFDQFSQAYEAKKAHRLAILEKINHRKNDLGQQQKCITTGRKNLKLTGASSPEPSLPPQGNHTPVKKILRQSSSLENREPPRPRQASPPSGYHDDCLFEGGIPSDLWAQSSWNAPEPDGKLSFSPCHHPLLPSNLMAPAYVDPWAPSPWSEAVQPNDIRTTFTSLPNVERPTVSQRHSLSQIFGPLDLPLGHVSSTNSRIPVPEDFFSYRQELNTKPSTGLGTDWDPATNVQSTARFGAIGQQGAPSRSLQHSPSSHSPQCAVPYLSCPTTAVIDGAPYHQASPILSSIGNVLLTGSELLPDLVGTACSLSRTSSSTSLSPQEPIGEGVVERLG